MAAAMLGIMQHEPRTFVTTIRRRPGSSNGHWWGGLVDDERTERLIRKIEANRFDAERNSLNLSAHERVCTERYKGLETAIEAVVKDVSEIKTSVHTMLNRSQAAAWSANWKAWAVAAFVATILISLIAWMAGQLYALEPARHAAAVQATKK